MAGFIFKQILVKSLPFGKKKDQKERLKKVSGPIKIVGAIYVLFLVIMFWRGLDIATSFSDSSGVERVSALIGSIFFVVSGQDHQLMCVFEIMLARWRSFAQSEQANQKAIFQHQCEHRFE